ncbi:hypothetical protein ACYSNU_10345 [Enterococcus sp. LJL120]
MTILEWIIIGGFAATIISIIFTLYSLLQVIIQSRKLKKLPQRPPKNKKKRRRWQQMISSIHKKRKRAGLFFITLLVLGGGMGVGTAYANFYQSTNLGSDDEDAIVRSYFLLRDFQSELEKAATQEETAEATSQNIRYLATNLSGYAARKASSLNTAEGQRALNRYYSALSELGMNATREIANFYGNAQLVSDFQSDIERTIGYETTAFDYFKVNQSVFETEEASEGE